MEEILLNNKRTSGTTTYVFSTNELNASSYDSIETSFLLFNNQGQADGIYYFNGDVLYLRNQNYNFVNINTLNVNILTGYTGIIVKTNIFTNSDKERYQRRLINQVTDLNADSQVFVFFEDKINEDLYINVGIQRTFDALNTFSVYNSAVNSYPTKESETGVIFGKL